MGAQKSCEIVGAHNTLTNTILSLPCLVVVEALYASLKIGISGLCADGKVPNL